MKVLSIFIIYRICHLECHFNIIVAFVTGVMHKADNAYLIQSTWLQLCYQLVRFFTVAYNGKYFTLDLSLIDLLLIFFQLDVSF